MINLKLKTIASFIEKEDVVLDTCCDHAYLAIYLKQNQLCKEVYASDINENALNQAKKILKHLRCIYALIYLMGLKVLII